MGEESTVSGGTSNDASNYWSTIAGGSTNAAYGEGSAVGGGYGNNALGVYAAIAGGVGNDATDFGTISGGHDNVTSINSYGSIGGGAVTGGLHNDAVADFSVVAGGNDNNVDALALYGAIGGGVFHTVSGQAAVVAGGNGNVASAQRSVVAGGYLNSAAGDYAAIGGGQSNDAAGNRATVPGGQQNDAEGDFSLAAGYRAKALHEGAFVWADSTDADFSSTALNQFLVRAAGGVGIGTDDPVAALHVDTDDTQTLGIHIEFSARDISVPSSQNLQLVTGTMSTRISSSACELIPQATWASATFRRMPHWT